MKSKKKPEIKNALALKDVQVFLDECIRTHEPVWVVALSKDGEICRYDGWQVSSSHWRGGTHTLLNVDSRQHRKIRDVLIFSINNHPVYI